MCDRPQQPGREPGELHTSLISATAARRQLGDGAHYLDTGRPGANHCKSKLPAAFIGVVCLPCIRIGKLPRGGKAAKTGADDHDLRRG